MRLRARAAGLAHRTVACLALVGVAACSTSPASGSAPAPPDNRYRQVNLAASAEAYQARFTMPEMVNAWGITIRPKGAGRHIWVAAGEAS
jgi:hypothetical protein